jgi:hypothetical protein
MPQREHCASLLIADQIEECLVDTAENERMKAITCGELDPAFRSFDQEKTNAVRAELD